MSLRVTRRIGPLPYTQIWFATEPRSGLFSLTRYFQCPNRVHKPGWAVSPFHTLLSDLQKSDQDLLSSYKSTCRNEVRQALGRGVVFQANFDVVEFLDFYNAFAAERGIAGLTLAKVQSFWPHLVLTAAVLDQKVLAIHGYLQDPEVARVRLLWSASARFETTEDRNFVAKANRALHYLDQIHFRDQNFAVYDWGGFDPQSTDPGIVGINRFKESFGGTPTIEYHYTPFWLKAYLPN